MIIAERKPIDELMEMIGGFKRVLALGCRGCVAECHVGSDQEVALLAEALRLAAASRKLDIAFSEGACERQCEWEWLDEISEQVEEADAVLSLACGVGIQAMAERYCPTRTFPAVNTTFMGMRLEQSAWSEMCAGCGDCVLHLTGGVCPVARCSKSLLNGPCGGSDQGKCEVDPENIPCGWQLVYDRLKAIGRLDLMDAVIPAKDWSTHNSGAGVRSSVRKDMIIE